MSNLPISGHTHECNICTEEYDCYDDDCNGEPDVCDDCAADLNNDVIAEDGSNLIDED